ncbi:MAG: hypothetical protein ACRDP3_26420 [Streptomyces sp.]|uniref:hypothetical protein n=1 Tax=Streptomyces sp. TaxID=1931 RepID=UPI003D6C60D8
MSTGPRQPAESEDPAPALVFGDPLSLRSADDTDDGWGEGGVGSGSGTPAADLARFLDEKPPHHV